MKTNPVYKREMTLSSRSMRVAMTIFVFNFLLAVVAILNMYMMREQVKSSSEVQYSAFLEMYILVAAIEFFLVTLMIPALTAGSISGERERQTLDLMLTTKMKPWEIVWGKLFSSFETIFILIISSFPILSLVFIYGGIRFYDMVLLLLQFYLAGIMLGTISIWLSAVCKKTVVATVISYLILGGLTGGTLALNYIVYYIQTSRFTDYVNVATYNVGGLVYIMLLNPAITFYEMINRQAGAQNAILKLCNQFGPYESNFVLDHWMGISCLLQVAIAVLFFWLAVRAINPMRRGRKE